MSAIHRLLTDHIDIWTAAETEKKTGRGRATGNAASVYGVKKLRELILELAMRGKLVPQDPNDEPASELLKRIEAEKATLIANGEIKKDMQIAAITKKEMPFELPPNWKWIQLATISKIITSGSRGWAQYLSDEGAKFITMGNLSRGSYELRLDNIRYVNPPKTGEGSRTKLEAHDVLCSITGEVGNLGRIPENFGEAYINQHTCLLRFLSQCKNRYYPEALRSPMAIKQFDAPQRGIKNSFRLGDLGEMVIPLPPLAEQHRIVAKVDELMALCDQLENQHSNASDAHEQLVGHLLDTLTQSHSATDFAANWQRVATHFDTLFITEGSIDALKQTLLQLAIMGRLVAQDSGDEPAADLLKRIIEERDRKIESEGSRTTANVAISDSELYMPIPKSWAYFRLGNLARFIDYRGKTPNKIDSGVPLITAKNVRFGYISREPKEFISKEEYTSWMTRGFPQPGDLLFTTEAPLGNVAVIDIVEEFALAQRVICFQLHDKSIGNFLKIALMSNNIQQRLVSAATGMTATGIKASKLKEILIPIPPIQEQFRIVAKVDELMMLCEKLKFRVNETNQLQKKIADMLVAASTGISNFSMKYSPPNAENMKITTTLELNSQVNPSIVEPLAKIIASLGGAADAKDVWKKSNLDLPDFYKQLKIEIESGFIRKPQPANFDA